MRKTETRVTARMRGGSSEAEDHFFDFSFSFCYHAAEGGDDVADGLLNH